MFNWPTTNTPKLGTLLTINHPTIAEVAKLSGFDWLWIDAEHGSFDESSAAVACAINIGGPKTFIRVPDSAATTLKRFLDVGADGIIIPQVSTVEQVEHIARHTLYPPLGQRSVGIGRANAYGGYLADQLRQRNHAIIIQIETVEGVRNIDAILQSPCVDAVIIGPYDLSGSFGIPGQIADPQVQQGIATTLAACRNAGKPCGIFSASSEAAQAYKQQGFVLIGVGIDSSIYLNALRKLAEYLR